MHKIFAVVCTISCSLSGIALAQDASPEQKDAMRKAGSVYLAVPECATFKNDPMILQDQAQATARTLGKSGQFPTISDQMRATEQVVQIYGTGQVKPDSTGQAACDLVDQAMK